MNNKDKQIEVLVGLFAASEENKPAIRLALNNLCDIAVLQANIDYAKAEAANRERILDAIGMHITEPTEINEQN